MQRCRLCPHDCRVNRAVGQVGYCGVGAESAIHWEGILCGEELEVVPSHEVFFSGCTMRCAFCYSHDHITRPMSGRHVTPEALARLAETRRRQGAINLNVVGGEPTVHFPLILRALRGLATPQPLVWNSNMFINPHAMELLDGVVDLFLGDIHFGSDLCARRLGRIPGYLDALTASFSAAVGSGASVIIRHLVMPGHVDCCARGAMEWAASRFPAVPFHVMFQYRPDYRAIGDPVLGHYLSLAEIEAATEIAADTGVLRYEEPQVTDEKPFLTLASRGSDDPIEILVLQDGRVSFPRLVPELMPVAGAVDPENSQLRARRSGVQP